MADIVADRPFDRVGHVLDGIRSHEEHGRRRLTPSAKFLAVVLARRLRLTAPGYWATWRGRASLAKLTGFSTRTVNCSRRELIEAGIFQHVPGVATITVAGGGDKPVARGCMVLVLVMDVEAYLTHRDAKREQLERERIANLQPEKLALQRQREDFGGTLTVPQYEAKVARLTRRPRARKAASW